MILRFALGCYITACPPTSTIFAVPSLPFPSFRVLLIRPGNMDASSHVYNKKRCTAVLDSSSDPLLSRSHWPFPSLYGLQRLTTLLVCEKKHRILRT